MTKLEGQRPQTSRSRQCAPPACASSTPWTIIKNTDVEIETDKRRAVMKLLQDDLAHDAASALWTDARPMRSAFAILEGPSPSAFS
jgi:anti-sigma factor RsiW